jgi:hypothetical protein
MRLIRPGVSPAQFSLSVQNNGLEQRHFFNTNQLNIMSTANIEVQAHSYVEVPLEAYPDAHDFFLRMSTISVTFL